MTQFRHCAERAALAECANCGTILVFNRKCRWRSQSQVSSVSRRCRERRQAKRPSCPSARPGRGLNSLASILSQQLARHMRQPGGTASQLAGHLALHPNQLRDPVWLLRLSTTDSTADGGRQSSLLSTHAVNFSSAQYNLTMTSHVVICFNLQ